MSGSITRIPAHELESAVTERVLECPQSPDLTSCLKHLAIGTGNYASIVRQADNKAKAWPALNAPEQEALLKSILDRVVVRQSSIEIRVNADALLKHLLDRQDRVSRGSLEATVGHEQQTFTVSCPFQRSRQGKALHFTFGTSRAPLPTSTTAILKAIAHARLWYDQIVSGEATSLRNIAKKHGFTPRYVKRIFPLASLGPDAISAIMNNQHNPHLSLDSLVNQIPMAWHKQRALLLPD